MTRDCAHQGHIWLEADGTPFNRRKPKGIEQAGPSVPVQCAHCEATHVYVGYKERA